MKKALVVGDSMTSGYGMSTSQPKVPPAVEDPSFPGIWCHRLLKSLGDFEIHNLASTGANNETIFHITSEHVLSARYDLVLVQWTFPSRLNLQVGLETYCTRSMLNQSTDINLVNRTSVSGKWLDELGQRMRWISNPHWHLLNLVRYANILHRLQSAWPNSQIFFVNGAVYIPKDYFTPMQYQVPSELPAFVQQMLSIDRRDDEEIRDLYLCTHRDYERALGIKPELWLNLYEPLRAMQVDDLAQDDHHPGLQSHEIFADFLKERLREKLS